VTLVPESAMPVVHKPWGREVWWAVTDRYAGKRLEVRAGHSLSLQYHERKLETLLVTDGRILLRVGEEEREVGPGVAVTIPPGTLHRLRALADAVIYEVSTPDLDDVVRVQDEYGRARGGMG
jgi:mannose-6-phosphate isomerase-like protein (cupin superfamily)